jgi:hypothetical protein
MDNAKKLLSVLWRPGRAMSYDVATWADTSSNQAIKDPGQLRRGYSNLGKIYYIFYVIKPVATRYPCVARIPHR